MTMNPTVPGGTLQKVPALGVTLRSSPDAGRSLWKFYIVLWAVLAILSAILYKVGAPWQVPLVIMAPVTLAGIAWRPLFGLSLMAALAPIGLAFAWGSIFSAEKGLGILLTLGTLAHLVATRKAFRFDNINVLTLAVLTLLSLLSITWSVYPPLSASYSFTLFQLFVYVALTLAIVRKPQDLAWPLRCFVVSSILTTVLPHVLGFSMAQGQRFTIGLSAEQVINPDRLAGLLGLGCLSSIYLFRTRPSAFWKIICIIGMVVTPVGVVLTGTRKVFFVLALMPLLPLLSPQAIARRRGLVAVLVIVAILLAGAMWVALEYWTPEQTAWRLTDPEYAKNSINFRLLLIDEAVAYVASHPLGAGMGCFFTSTGNLVHNDLFYVLSSLGLPGASLFAVYLGWMLVRSWRMKAGMDKWFAQAIVVYHVLLGLAATWIYFKHVWLFMTFASLLWTFQTESGQEGVSSPRSVSPPGIDPLGGQSVRNDASARPFRA